MDVSVVVISIINLYPCVNAQNPHRPSHWCCVLGHDTLPTLPRVNGCDRELMCGGGRRGRRCKLAVSGYNVAYHHQYGFCKALTVSKTHLSLIPFINIVYFPLVCLLWGFIQEVEMHRCAALNFKVASHLGFILIPAVSRHHSCIVYMVLIKDAQKASWVTFRGRWSSPPLLSRGFCAFVHVL